MGRCGTESVCIYNMHIYMLYIHFKLSFFSERRKIECTVRPIFGFLFKKNYRRERTKRDNALKPINCTTDDV